MTPEKVLRNKPDPTNTMPGPSSSRATGHPMSNAIAGICHTPLDSDKQDRDLISGASQTSHSEYFFPPPINTGATAGKGDRSQIGNDRRCIFND